jgi:hypothetical protein
VALEKERWGGGEGRGRKVHQLVGEPADFKLTHWMKVKVTPNNTRFAKHARVSPEIVKGTVSQDYEEDSVTRFLDSVFFSFKQLPTTSPGPTDRLRDYIRICQSPSILNDLTVGYNKGDSGRIFWAYNLLSKKILPIFLLCMGTTIPKDCNNGQ